MLLAYYLNMEATQETQLKFLGSEIVLAMEGIRWVSNFWDVLANFFFFAYISIGFYTRLE